MFHITFGGKAEVLEAIPPPQRRTTPDSLTNWSTCCVAVFQAKAPLPRIGLRYDDEDPQTVISGRKTTRAMMLPRIGMRHIKGTVVLRSSPSSLGQHSMPGERRSLPLPRIGRNSQHHATHWNLENRLFSAVRRAKDDWRTTFEKRPVPLPRMG